MCSPGSSPARSLLDGGLNSLSSPSGSGADSGRHQPGHIAKQSPADEKVHFMVDEEGEKGAGANLITY